MARFSSIICAAFIFLGVLAQAQITRPPHRVQRSAIPTAPQQVLPPVAPTAPQPTPTPAATGPSSPQAQSVIPPLVPVVPTAVAAPPQAPIGPAVPPVVTFRDGLLSVQAMNSNLSSVVAAIRNKTGIEFEGAENVSERVVISLGPAPEGDVLAAIFSGSNYDFVALGRPDSPSMVQRVILTLKSKPGGATEAQGQPRSRPQIPEGDEEETPDEQVNNGGGDPQDTAVQPPQVPQQQPPQAEQQPQQQNQQPKTPEQLLQELQQMQNQKAPPDNQNPSQAPRKQPPN